MSPTRKFTYLLALFILLNLKGFSNSFIQLDSLALAKVKQKLHDGTASERTQSAYKDLISRANKLLTIQNPTVMDKNILPPTNDKHDYLSISRYWWPDPKSTTGLPWIRKDGETNPDTQTDAVDRKRMATMTSGVKNLCLAYYFSNDERYAQKAASMLKTWFLEEATLMNPHLKFAQSVPGYSKGRSSGILDGKSISDVIPDALLILSKSSHWTKNDNLKINNWLNDYLTWLTESELGIKENNQDNNHASWYKFQIANLSFHLNNRTLTKKIITSTQESLEKQLDFEGKQIHELERTRSFFYSCYNLEALTGIAIVGDKIDMDLWNYESENNKSLTLALEFLIPVIHGESWNYTEINGVDLSDLLPSLIRISNHIKSNRYTDLINKTIKILVEKEKTTGKTNPILNELSLTGNLDI
ncbi:alginate lyase family protein [Mariniflexile sp.]|uniref:alginate lyase family protein n=1 Tax=Mariniflexile sp. TaxID=1979402 RepID=UPI0035680842